MNKAQAEIEAFMPLTPAVLYILLALADADRHGYDIMRTVAVNSEGKIKMGAGTLYGSIQRMLRSRLIAKIEPETDAPGEDPRRRYYTLTELGRRVLMAELTRLSGVVEIARRKDLLQDGGAAE